MNTDRPHPVNERGRVAASPPAPLARRGWALVLFRAATTAAAALAAAEPVLAGGLLQGHYAMLATHNKMAVYLAVALLVALLGAVLTWRAARAAVLCAVALLLCIAQMVLGYTRDLIIHVPLGVLLVALVVYLPVLAWRMPLSTPRPVPAGWPANQQPAVRL
ncbi:MAG TPA: hypothetical protein VHW44_20950 [Pseudonocardiaceae bacterium]|jgi:hypothetical protein|nr:hypothetical protein [Pseudonocardiaceae bacterium]